MARGEKGVRAAAIFKKEEKSIEKGEKLCYNKEAPSIGEYICPWHSWIARQTPTLKVEGSNPFGQAKKSTSIGLSIFYPSRRLGMESRVSVYGTAVGVWHHRRCISCGLIPYATPSQFHTATSCGFHTRLSA